MRARVSAAESLGLAFVALTSLRFRHLRWLVAVGENKMSAMTELSGQPWLHIAWQRAQEVDDMTAYACDRQRTDEEEYGYESLVLVPSRRYSEYIGCHLVYGERFVSGTPRGCCFSCKNATGGSACTRTWSSLWFARRA